MINNSVYGGFPERCIGFRCFECGGIFQSMWGTTCNGCRHVEERHQEIIEALKK